MEDKYNKNRWNGVAIGFRFLPIITVKNVGGLHSECKTSKSVDTMLNKYKKLLYN